MPSPTHTSIALIGECLIELTVSSHGTLHQAFGGDSLNTALYLARLTRGQCEVKYVTVLGVDGLSEGMIQRWGAEGIDTSLTLRDANRLPGLYLIQVDQRGERTFLYWRGDSAARYLLQHPGFDHVATKLAEVDLIYLSAISLAILPAADRANLVELLTQLAARGMTLAVDSNYRPSLWPSVDSARVAMCALLPAARLLFVTFEDEQRLWGDRTPEATLERLHSARVPSVVIKLGASGCLYSNGTSVVEVAAVPVATVIDTTAAGDAFNAGFLAARLMDHTAEECCRIGNALAGEVIQHRGAIMPAAATPSLADLLRKGRRLQGIVDESD